MTKVEKFTHNGREFEITATAARDQGYEVKLFYKGKPMSVYSVTSEIACDLNTTGWGNVLDALIALAKEDIANNPELKVAIETASRASIP